jgi:hypothetical protein
MGSGDGWLGSEAAALPAIHHAEGVGAPSAQNLQQALLAADGPAPA